MRVVWQRVVVGFALTAALVGCGDGGGGTRPAADAVAADVIADDGDPVDAVSSATPNVTATRDAVTTGSEVSDVAPEADSATTADIQPDSGAGVDTATIRDAGDEPSADVAESDAGADAVAVVPDVSPDVPVVLECGDERPRFGSLSAAIVSGVPDWDPELVALADSQALAVGAVMDNSRWGDDNFCTATLVQDDVALTAAHCVVGDWGDVTDPDEVRFGVGEDVSDPVALIDVAAVIAHPDYDPWGATSVHDIALLVLATPASEVVPGLRPIPINCDALSARELEGSSLQVVGYGATNEYGDRTTTIRTWAVEEIVEVTSFDILVDGHGDQGVCYGDSGGPALWTFSDGLVRVIGDLSWGDELCAHQDHFVRTDYECAFVTEWVSPCMDVTEAGSCEGDDAVWCEDDALIRDDCAARDETCAEDDAGRSRCVTATLDPCDGETLQGRCVGDDAVWCEDGEIRVRRCAECGQACGWDDARGVYYCQ